MKRILTIDLEKDLGSDKSKSIELILPKLLNFFDDHKIKATFFTVTNLLEKYESEIKEISKKHEIASHSHTHPNLTDQNAEFEIKKSKETLKEYGHKCLGFRAPKFITIKNHFKLLKKYGYKYDSSLATFFPGRYNNKNIIKNNPFYKSNILEFPIPTFINPLIDSGLPYLKLFSPISRIFKQQYLFYLHPWEFLKKKDLPQPKSLIHSSLRSNSGPKAWNLFQEHLLKEECRWVCCKNWMKRYGSTLLTKERACP